MFEMFITFVVAIGAAIYGLSQTVFMEGPNQLYYRLGAITIIVFLILFYYIRNTIKKRHLRKLHVNIDDYYYYDKFTSPLYQIGYFISYFFQNLLFDYTYMRRNFNFCKGLDTYDAGVSEYYIKFRNTWYNYLKLLIIRHRVSLHKLRSFACAMMNELIFTAMEDEEKKAFYKSFSDQVEAYMDEHHYMNRAIIQRFEGCSDIDSYFRRNLTKRWHMLEYVKKKEPVIIDLVQRQDLRGRRDVNDFKKMKF